MAIKRRSSSYLKQGGLHNKETKEQKKTRNEAEKQSIEQVRQTRGQVVEEDTALRTGENTIEGVPGCVWGWNMLEYSNKM